MIDLDALFLIAKERQRQIEEEGWDESHDDEHEHGELAAAAACYSIPPETPNFNSLKMELWPWSDEWWKPKGRVSDLVRAGALILAELERIRREETNKMLEAFADADIADSEEGK